LSFTSSPSSLWCSIDWCIAKLPNFTSEWQPLYMEFNFDNVLQHGLQLKSFLCFVQHPTCVMPESAETSAPNTHRQRKQVPTAPQFLLVKCNMSRPLNVCSMWLVLSVFRPMQGRFLVVLFTSSTT